MIALPDMIAEAAVQAGIKVPPNCGEYEPNDFPHWHVYCNLQLCRPVTWGNHWENAKIIAAVPKEKLRTMTEADFVVLGFDP